MNKKQGLRGPEVSDEQILDFVLKFYHQHKHWPNGRNITESNLGINGPSVAKRFINSEMIIHAAKMRGGLLSESDMVAVRRCRASLLTKLRAHPDYDALWHLRRTDFGFDPELPSLPSILYAFGTLDTFLRTAGVPPIKPNADDIIRVIRLVAERMGRTPTLRDCGEGFCCYDRGTIKKFFPSWNSLLRAAGLVINEEQLSKQKPATKRAVAQFERQRYQLVPKPTALHTPRTKRPSPHLQTAELRFDSSTA